MRDETFEQLLMEEVRLVFRYLQKMGASKEDAEDIVQDTLCKTIKNIEAIDGDKIRAWLFKVAINSYYNLYNKNKKRSSIPLNELHNFKISTESAEDYILTEEKRRAIQKALDSLKPSYRELLIFKYVLDLSYKDIATALEIKEEKVKIYLYRARNKFKEIWEGSNLE